MEQLTGVKFINLARKWYELGVGYSVATTPETQLSKTAANSSSSAEEAQAPLLDPEATIVETLPLLLQDGAFAGLVLACLIKFKDCFLPARIPAIFASSLSGDRAEMAAVVLSSLAKKLSHHDEAWTEVAKFAEAAVSKEFVQKVQAGQVQFWPSEMDGEIRMVLRLCAEDEDLARFGVRYPEITPAPAKKLRDEASVFRTNETFVSRSAARRAKKSP